MLNVNESRPGNTYYSDDPFTVIQVHWCFVKCFCPVKTAQLLNTGILRYHKILAMSFNPKSRYL